MYTYEMARALSTLPSLQVHLSLSRQSELLKESQELGLPGWPVDTYTGPMDALRASLRLPRLRRKFSAYLDRERFDWVCCTMTHLWNPFMLKGVRQAGLAICWCCTTLGIIPASAIRCWGACSNPR